MALRVLSVVLPALLVFTVAVNTARRDTCTARNHGTARIIDGKPAKVGQFPHQAYIFAERVNSSVTKVCGGTLIGRKAVLTEKACVEAFQKWTIRLGGIHRTEHEETAWTTVSPWALVHPKNDGKSEYANLAIIYLVHDAPLNDNIKPAELPSSLEANTTYLLKTGVVSGWGYTTLDNGKEQEILHWTEVTIVPSEICKKSYQHIDMTDKLCAANENVGVFWGDDGTGLHLRTRHGFKQIGILAIHGYGSNTRPAVYTRVASHIDWINIKAHFSD